MGLNTKFHFLQKPVLMVLYNKKGHKASYCLPIQTIFVGIMPQVQHRLNG